MTSLSDAWISHGTTVSMGVTYTVQESDEGGQITLTVTDTADNGGGTSTASATTGTVIDAPPHVSVIEARQNSGTTYAYVTVGTSSSTLWMQVLDASANPAVPVAAVTLPNSVSTFPAFSPTNPFTNVSVSSNADGSYDLFWLETTTTGVFPNVTTQTSLHEQTYAANSQAEGSEQFVVQRASVFDATGSADGLAYAYATLAGSSVTLWLQVFDANGTSGVPVSVVTLPASNSGPPFTPTNPFTNVCLSPVRTVHSMFSGKRPPRRGLRHLTFPLKLRCMSGLIQQMGRLRGTSS